MHKKKNDSEESNTRAWGSVERITASHGLSRNSLYALINKGKIQAKLVLGRRLISVRSLEQFIEAQNTHAPAKVMRKMRKLALASIASRRAAKLARRRRVKGGGK